MRARIAAAPPPWKDDPFRARLLALYAEVDALLAPFSCDASADCCRFGVTGREPYPTAVELAEVAHALRGLGGRPPTKAEKAPQRRGGSSRGGGKAVRLPLAEGGSPCPLLSSEGRCRIYASRPFGCRTFFCERVSGPGKIPRDAVARLSRAIADLAAAYDPIDPHARPFTRALGRLGWT